MADDACCPVKQYAVDVTEGRVVANHWVRLACKRHLEDLILGPSRGLFFDHEAAKRATEFFPMFLRFYEGSFDGKPFTLLPFQQFIVGSLFGWKTADGFRRFRTAYVEMGKGGGKSPLAAGIGLYGLVADGESGAEIYSAATTRDQAGILFRDAKAFAAGSPALLRRLTVDKGNIAYTAKNSYFRPVSSEHRALDGKRPHIALIDEIHEHPSAMVVDKMRAGTKGRTQALIFEITNAGYDRHSVCYQHHEYSEKVLECVIENDAWFGYMAGLDVCESCAAGGRSIPVDDCPDCDSWKDESKWIKANPGLDIIIPRKYLREQVAEASEMPSKENIVKRLNFCVWCVAPWTLVTMIDGSRRRADELQPGNMILSFDEETQQLRRAKVTKAKNNGIHPVVKVTTARGREITVTGNHRFWVRSGRADAPKYGWVEASELKPGTKVGVALGHAIPRGSRRIRAEEAQFLGIMVGDGTCAKSGLRVTNQNEGVIDFCRRFVEGHGCKLVQLPDGVHWDIRHPVKLHSPKQTRIRVMIKKHGLNGKTCFNKRVPDLVFKGGENVWSAFMAGYFDTDGCIAERSAVWASVNHDLLSDCQHLLALLGVQSTLRRVTNQYRLEVSDARSLDILAARMPLSHTEKKEKLAKLGSLGRRPGKWIKNEFSFDRVASVSWKPKQPTIGIEIEQTHTHITNGLITHNTESVTKWLSMEKWVACGGEVDAEALKGRTCYGGLDLSSVSDVTAWVKVFPPEAIGKPYPVLCRFFLPADNMRERVRRDKVPYDVWAKQGFITLTPGNIIDYAFILDAIRKDAEDYDIAELAFDRWGSQKITTDLQDIGFEVEGRQSLIQFGQGFASMAAPTKELEKMVLGGELAHGGNPVLAWMVSNTVIRTDPAGNMKPDKEKSTEKIDGVVALIMALSRTMLKNETVSIYESRGVLTFGTGG